MQRHSLGRYATEQQFALVQAHGVASFVSVATRPSSSSHLIVTRPKQQIALPTATSAASNGEVSVAMRPSGSSHLECTRRAASILRGLGRAATEQQLATRTRAASARARRGLDHYATEQQLVRKEGLSRSTVQC